MTLQHACTEYLGQADGGTWPTDVITAKEGAQGL